jgi:hypothetical protein
MDKIYNKQSSNKFIIYVTPVMIFLVFRRIIKYEALASTKRNKDFFMYPTHIHYRSKGVLYALVLRPFLH